MADTKYRIQLEMDKASASTVNESIKEFSKTLENVTKTIKPLADSMSSAFSQKTLDNINKMTQTFSNLERTIEGLSKKMSNLGLNLNSVAQSQGFKEISAFTAGTILGPDGRPIVTPSTSPGPAMPGVTPPPATLGAGVGVGGVPPSAFAPPAGGIWGTLANVALRGVGIQAAAGGISTALNLPGDLRRIYVTSELARLETQRMGVSSAIEGRIADYYMHQNYQMDALDRSRIFGAGAGNILSQVGRYGAMGAAGGGALGALFGGIGAVPGAVIGGVVGSLYGAGVGILGYGRSVEQERQRILLENINRNQEYRDIINMTTQYAESISPAERFYGRTEVDRMILTQSLFGRGAATDFINRMAAQGIGLRGTMMATDPFQRGPKIRREFFDLDRLIGIERNLRAGALLSVLGTRTRRGVLDTETADQVINILSRSGMDVTTDVGLAATQRTAEFAAHQIQQMGVLGNEEQLSRHMTRIMGYTGTAQQMGISGTAAAEVGAHAFEMHRRLHSGRVGLELGIGGLMGTGLDAVSAMRVQRRIEQGDMEGAQALARQLLEKSGKTFDPERFQRAANLPREMQQRLMQVYGGAEAFGDIFSDVTREAMRVQERGPIVRPSSPEENQKIRDTMSKQTMDDKIKAARTPIDEAVIEMAQSMKDKVIPVMEAAANAFLERVSKGRADQIRQEQARRSAEQREAIREEASKPGLGGAAGGF